MTGAIADQREDLGALVSTRARPASSSRSPWSPPTARSSASTRTWCAQLPGLMAKLDRTLSPARIRQQQHQRADRGKPRAARQLHPGRAAAGRPDAGRTAHADPRPAPRRQPPRRQPRRLCARPPAAEGVRTEMTTNRCLPRAAALSRMLAHCFPRAAGRLRHPAEEAAACAYAPHARVTAEPGWPTVSWQLQVPRPHADELLDSPRIVVRPLPGELQVYKGAVWAQPAPDLLLDTVLRAFEDSPRIPGVARRGSGIAGDYELLLDLRRFESDYAGAATPRRDRSRRETRCRCATTAWSPAARSARSGLQRRPTSAKWHRPGSLLAAITGEIVGWTLTKATPRGAESGPGALTRWWPSASFSN